MLKYAYIMILKSFCVCKVLSKLLSQSLQLFKIHYNTSSPLVNTKECCTLFHIAMIFF